jgi:ferredoxin
MRISIDPALCEGHGRCWTIAPQLFDADEDGAGIVLSEVVPAELVEIARRAVLSCPERAVMLSED